MNKAVSTSVEYMWIHVSLLSCSNKYNK